MKKTYIKPTIECIKVKVDSLLQASVRVSNEEQPNDQALSRGFFMDFEEEDNVFGSDED